MGSGTSVVNNLENDDIERLNIESNTLTRYHSFWSNWLEAAGLPKNAAEPFSIFLVHKGVVLPEQLVDLFSTNKEFISNILRNGILSEHDLLTLVGSQIFKDFQRRGYDYADIAANQGIPLSEESFQQLAIEVSGKEIASRHYLNEDTARRIRQETHEEMMALLDSALQVAMANEELAHDLIGVGGRNASESDDLAAMMKESDILQNHDDMVIIVEWSEKLSSSDIELTRNMSRAFRERSIGCFPAAISAVLACRVCATIRLDSSPKKTGDFSFGFAVRSIQQADGGYGFGKAACTWGIVNVENSSAVYEEGNLVSRHRLLQSGDKLSISINLFEDCAHLFLNDSVIACFPNVNTEYAYVIGATLSPGQCITLLNELVYIPDIAFQAGLLARIDGEERPGGDMFELDRFYALSADQTLDITSATSPTVSHRLRGGRAPAGLSQSTDSYGHQLPTTDDDDDDAYQDLTRSMSDYILRGETQLGGDSRIISHSLENEPEEANNGGVDDSIGSFRSPRAQRGQGSDHSSSSSRVSPTFSRDYRITQGGDDTPVVSAMAGGGGGGGSERAVTRSAMRAGRGPAPSLSAAALRRIETLAKISAASAAAAVPAPTTPPQVASGNPIARQGGVYSRVTASSGVEPRSLYVPADSVALRVGTRGTQAPSPSSEVQQRREASIAALTAEQASSIQEIVDAVLSSSGTTAATSTEAPLVSASISSNTNPSAYSSSLGARLSRKVVSESPSSPSSASLSPSLPSSANSCCICMEGDKCVVLIPCRHLCLCESCGSGAETTLRLCPICRESIVHTIRIYT